MGRARRMLLGLAAALPLAAAAAAAWLHTPDADRAALEAAHAPPPSRFVEVLGLRVHLRDAGPRDGPALLLLHGFGASLHTWEGRAARLEDRFRVIRLAMPVLLLWGERDRMIPARHARDWLALLPQAEHVELPGLGQLPQEEAPEVSLPPVRAFLEG
jgi:pimeloyl-ACP methyl ester carboxylesterase